MKTFVKIFQGDKMLDIENSINQWFSETNGSIVSINTGLSVMGGDPALVVLIAYCIDD